MLTNNYNSVSLIRFLNDHVFILERFCKAINSSLERFYDTLLYLGQDDSVASLVFALAKSKSLLDKIPRF